MNPNGGAPSATVATVTVVGASAPDNFVAWGGGDPAPTTSVLNWTAAGQVVANTTVIPEGGRTGNVKDFSIGLNGPSGTAGVVGDVVGYFVQNSATPLDCLTYQSAGVPLPPGSSGTITSSACTAGYTTSGGGCRFNTSAGSIWQTEPTNGDAWMCGGNNTGGTFAALLVTLRCCRVPGL